LIARWG